MPALILILLQVLVSMVIGALLMRLWIRLSEIPDVPDEAPDGVCGRCGEGDATSREEGVQLCDYCYAERLRDIRESTPEARAARLQANRDRVREMSRQVREGDVRGRVYSPVDNQPFGSVPCGAHLEPSGANRYRVPDSTPEYQRPRMPVMPDQYPVVDGDRCRKDYVL